MCVCVSAVVWLKSAKHNGSVFFFSSSLRKDIGDTSERKFVVGNTVNTCTKGINMYIRPPKQSGTYFCDVYCVQQKRSIQVVSCSQDRQLLFSWTRKASVQLFGRNRMISNSSL